MTFLRNLWVQIRASEWFWQLPEWLREPPGLWIAAGALILTPLALIFRLAWKRRPPSYERASRKQARRAVQGEIRECRARGDERGAGQRYESLGDHRAALAAYRRGGHHADAADLLRRRGKPAKAKAAAREGEEWSLYAELCEADGELEEAASAYERAGQVYAAALSYERAGQRDRAAECYLRAGMDAKAAELLMAEGGRETAERLDAAVRSSLERSRTTNAPFDVEMEPALRRCAQLWLEEGEPERAYRLAADGEQWEVAVPIARDHLPPQPETAETCSRAGAHLAAAEIYGRLGDRRREALARAEHFQIREDAAESARWYQAAEEWDLAAEQWAASGELGKAAELFARSGDFRSAARLYGETGEAEKQQEMATRASTIRTPSPPEADLSDSLQATELLVPAADSAADRYLLQEEIGRGGMGVVYRARDLLLKRTVAYKVLARHRDADPDEVDQLLAEARAAARLSHPNIVQVYDAGRDERGFFLVMELVEGENFARLLAERRLSLQGSVVVGRQICAALSHAHQRRIIHRDLKPSNLIWTPEKRVKLTDFGLARAFEESLGKVFTRPAGTPYYMAPEQIRGEAVDPRTDLYSLGCVLFEMVTRRAPFGGGSSIHHHLETPPDDPRSLVPDLPAKLAELILGCLEKDPARRPASAKEVGRILADLAKRR